MSTRLRSSGATPAAHHAQKHRQYGRDPLAVVGEAVANFVRKAEHPLAHRHPGQHLVDQARRRSGHAPAAAGGAEPPLLAGKGNGPARPAVLTPGAHEPVGQNAAFEVGPHLLLDLERQSVLGRSGLLEKGFQMPGEDLVEGLLFRFAATVLGWADRCGRHGAGPTAMGGPPVLASVVFRGLAL